MYPWGRASYLATLQRFYLPPSVLVKDPLQAMHVHLSQQTTACYGFPLALQLFAFQALPGLVAKIPQADRTANFFGGPYRLREHSYYPHRT